MVGEHFRDDFYSTSLSTQHSFLPLQKFKWDFIQMQGLHLSFSSSWLFRNLPGLKYVLFNSTDDPSVISDSLAQYGNLVYVDKSSVLHKSSLQDIYAERMENHFASFMVSEANKIYAEQKEEEIRILENLVEELDSTINVNEIDEELERQHKIRDSLEVKLQSLNQRLSTEAHTRIKDLEEERTEQANELKQCKEYISEVVIHAETQAFQYQQKLVKLNAHSLFSKWFSESGKLVAKLFQQIQDMVEEDNTLVFVLIDEVESLAAARKAALSGSEPSDSIRVVNALLTQMDKLKSSSNVIILTTSNITAAIDIAFVDRADIKAYVGPPTLQAR
ncbi:hypothetical protein L2E82_25024 [Cichorium intybus]|uniref:Uncharacterized protein n=1 Tax=Cichorium intybus TaxID=13427 RepID=A0ACB9E3G1_CICIN|nr:hypothetical protein L2E82_25024 [Cichorium intybus]